MSSPEQDFQIAVDATPARGEREDAIDRLADAGACDKLAVLVQLGGLDGPLRRRALNGLDRAGCTDVLGTLVEKGGLEASLRSDAEEMIDG